MSLRHSFIVLGAGAWGSALALHLSRQQHEVVLWGHNAAEIAELSVSHTLECYLPGITFPSTIQFTHDIAKAFELAGNDPVVLIVVPSFAFDDITHLIAPHLKVNTPVLWGTKGLSAEGEFFEVVCQRNTGRRPMGVVSGPSFAQEVAKELPTAMTLATRSPEWGPILQQAFHSERMRIYLSTDMVGVQLGGIIKNIIAIAVGMSDGLGYGANARCALVTRGLAELTRLGQALGANPSTFMGLSGVGDMVLTCTDNQSRNRRFGIALGEGKSINEAIAAVGKVVEGKLNVIQVIALAKRHQVEMPICEQAFAVLFEGATPQEAVTRLLLRSPKTE